MLLLKRFSLKNVTKTHTIQSVGEKPIANSQFWLKIYRCEGSFQNFWDKATSYVGTCVRVPTAPFLGADTMLPQLWINTQSWWSVFVGHKTYWKNVSKFVQIQFSSKKVPKEIVSRKGTPGTHDCANILTEIQNLFSGTASSECWRTPTFLETVYSLHVCLMVTWYHSFLG